MNQAVEEIKSRDVTQASASALDERIDFNNKKEIRMKIKNRDNCLFTGMRGRLRQKWEKNKN